ncbi:MAG: hypothetical protein JWN35_3241, partial [Frankiales bacterium]|nr:hypothetical protein [Frankiales bacterium]
MADQLDRAPTATARATAPATVPATLPATVPATVLGTGLATGLLLAAAPSPAQAVHTVSTAAAATDPCTPLVALVALAAWVLAGWVLLTALLLAGGRLPGLVGRGARGACRRVAPYALRRLVEVALGLTVAAGALGASPAS